MQIGKKRKTRTKSKTPGALIYNVPGSRSGGIPLRAATDMVATPHCGARFLSVEKGFDEISATGGHRILSPRPFGPESKIWSVFRFSPLLFSEYRQMPVVAGFSRLFPLLFRLFPVEFKPDKKLIRRINRNRSPRRNAFRFL